MATRFALIRFAASCFLCLAASSAPAATTAELLRLTEQLDQLDKMDFDQAIDKAGACVQARDFDCSEAQLKIARKLVVGSAAKETLGRAEARQREEREAVEAERLALARRQRELDEQERRLQAAERQAARAADEGSGMSSAQGAALFGSLLAQAYKGQAVARMAEAAQGERIRRQLEASRGDVARNQQRFAEERARLEAQRARLQPASVPQPVRQQPPPQREPEAAAAQRAPQAPRQEVDVRAGASTSAPGQERAAQSQAAATTTALTPAGNASGSRPSAGATASGAAAQDSRVKLHGTMYVVHYAALKHSHVRSKQEKINLVGKITPVQWTYDVPRVSQDQPPSGRWEHVPFQVSDMLLKMMRPRFGDYLRSQYTICADGVPAPDGCYGTDRESAFGDNAAQVQEKLNAGLRGLSAPITHVNGPDYPPSIAYRE
ncbi:hypothetical protein N0K08_03110 [Acidovorax sp. Be4]|uniref:Uncharacterized protein n=1 Tax=Acidovorax bellezanensis TaxID=2976702 RepID=A0ABT2PGR1_9BURK|nr:hypothetical protein [Acidovorax sp. Be4]MCT9809616.1 hypothetical protein [Acidovorax sp. Be4]